MNLPRRTVVNRTAVVYGQTPVGMQRTHLLTMAEKMNMHPVSFSRKILSMDDEELFTLMKDNFKDNSVLETFFKNFSLYEIDGSASSCGSHQNNTSPKVHTIKSRKILKKSHQNMNDQNSKYGCRKKYNTADLDAEATFESLVDSIFMNKPQPEISNFSESELSSSTKAVDMPTAQKWKATYERNLNTADLSSNSALASCGTNGLNNKKESGSGETVIESNSILTSLLFGDNFDSEVKYNRKDNSKIKLRTSEQSNQSPSNTLLESLLFS